MKYIKTFESRKKVFKVGQYVISEFVPFKTEIKNFLENNIGQIIGISKNFGFNDKPYTAYNVKYTNIPLDLKWAFKNDIQDFYPENIRLATKEEMIRYKLDEITNKFNI